MNVNQFMYVQQGRAAYTVLVVLVIVSLNKWQQTRRCDFLAIACIEMVYYITNTPNHTEQGEHHERPNPNNPHFR